MPSLTEKINFIALAERNTDSSWSILSRSFEFSTNWAFICKQACFVR